MKPKYRTATLLTATVLILWAVFSWPLPKYFSDGIPQSDHNVEKDHVRLMIPGDQLQLMYHFWLAKDMIAGRTPLFTNIYEFNRGDDDELYRPDPYYAPYSLVFAFFSSFLSRASAWNIAGLLSIFVTFISSFLLIKRLTKDTLAAFLSALLATTFPYRWITLLIGSPTGFGISLVPLTALGLHIAVRDGKWTGGLLAGIAVFFSFCSDLHVVYFNMLSIPFWTILFLIIKEDFSVFKPTTWKKPLLGLSPVIILTAFTAFVASVMSSHLQKTDMVHGRSESLVAKYSARSRGLFSWDNLGMDNHVFLGHIAVLIAIIALIVMIISLLKKRIPARHIIFFAAILIGALCIVSLALGANGAWDGWMLWKARSLVPKYKMIRQAVKIYCLMPLFFTVLAGLGIHRFLTLVPAKRHPKFWICVLTILCIIEWRMQISPTICLLADKQNAYEAVADDAEERGVKPHAAIVPLWPGDSHWSSLYEHYVSLYRIRMINGYSPAIGDEYYNDVILPLDTINRGVVTDEQIDILEGMKVDYLIFHQDAYPDQVSPYPASQALFRFLSHPRLKLLEQSQSIWAFQILHDKRTNDNSLQLPEYMVSMRGWEMESSGILKDYGEVVPAERASGPALKLTSHYAEMESRPFVSAPGQQLALRLKGHGTFKWQILADDELMGSRTVTVDSDSWQWMTLPFKSDREHFIPKVTFSSPEGDIFFDMMFLTAGKEVRLDVGDKVRIPAAALYGQGYINLSDMSVTLRKEKDQDLEVLYGMFPMLDKGTYQIELDIESESNSQPGSIIYLAHTNPPFETPIENPGKFEHIYKHPDNFPVKIGFKYSRNADLTVKSLTIKRIQ